MRTASPPRHRKPPVPRRQQPVTTTGTRGAGSLGALVLLLAVLKLAGVIAWSWWWVFSPLLASAALITCMLMVIGVLLVRPTSRRGF